MRTLQLLVPVPIYDSRSRYQLREPSLNTREEVTRFGKVLFRRFLEEAPVFAKFLNRQRAFPSLVLKF